MSLSQDHAPSFEARYGLGTLVTWRRITREDDERRDWLDAKCGLDPNRQRPTRAKDWAPPSHRKIGPE